MPRTPIDRWRFATAGLELVGIVGVLLAIGYGFDRWLDTEPWGMVIGAVVGIVGGLYRLVRDALRWSR